MSVKYDNQKTEECNCDQANLHLHVEIENLKQRLLEKERHIIKMETNFLKEAERFPNGEYAAIMEELLTWQDKYSRLYEAHKRVQKVNQGLEDKLLKIVDKCETEKTALNGELVMLTKKFVDEQVNNSKLIDENERYRNDLSVAISLLQCKPSNFVPQKFDILPSEFQIKVKSYVTNKNRKYSDGGGNGNSGTQKTDMKTIKVPIPTFPPTAMVYSLGPDKDENQPKGSDNGKLQQPVDHVSAAIMAKVLEERENERINAKHCQSCTCTHMSKQVGKFTQTTDDDKNTKNGRVIYPSTDMPDMRSVIIEMKPSGCNKTAANDSGKEIMSKLPWSCDVSSEDRCIDPWSPISSEASSQPDSSSEFFHNNDYSSDESYNNSQLMKSVSINFKDDSNRDLISFDSSPSNENYKGPRPCSVRIQAGSNNILLDNASRFAGPILYRRRNSNIESSGEPLVHHNSRNQLLMISPPPLIGRYTFSTETEI